MVRNTVIVLVLVPVLVPGAASYLSSAFLSRARVHAYARRCMSIPGTNDGIRSPAVAAALHRKSLGSAPRASAPWSVRRLQACAIRTSEGRRI